MDDKMTSQEDMQVPFVDLRSGGLQRCTQVEESVSRVLRRAWFILGEELAAFETEFALYCGVEHCIGVNSGTDALHLALKACGIGPGDEVITVSHTFIATALAIDWSGATPVFVDINPCTFTIDVNQVADAITPRTRAIIPVHLYGQCADMDPLLSVAKCHGLRIIEDAAQAHGATYYGRKAGNLGDVACFSFYPTKNLGACGDGGALTTNDSVLAERLRRLRNYGQTRKYYHETMGYNTRLDEIQAAILHAKLPYLDEENARRRQIAARYLNEIDVRFGKPLTAKGREHVYHIYSIQCNERDLLQLHLSDRNIQTQIHYPMPVHQQPAFKGKGKYLDLTITERVARQVLSLPMYPTMTEEQVTRVCRAVNSYET